LKYRTEEWDRRFWPSSGNSRRRASGGVLRDLNVAHTEIDLTNPKTIAATPVSPTKNGRISPRCSQRLCGHVPRIREGPGPLHVWSQMMNCRARNIGWRVDYFVASEKLKPALKRAWISPDVMGSDHCPSGWS